MAVSTKMNKIFLSQPNPITTGTDKRRDREVNVSIVDEQDECDIAQTTFDCLVCLEELPMGSVSTALRCAHYVCRDCQLAYWTHSIEVNKEPFPRCVLRLCKEYASRRELAALLPPRLLHQVTQLQAIHPTRAVDGRVMFCITPKCMEPLPPPLENKCSGVAVSACPECKQRACLRCASAAHDGKLCIEPLVSERDANLYVQYAVRRLTACPECGVHIARVGDCNNIQCTQCQREFVFRPFRTIEEVIEASPNIETGSVSNAQRSNATVGTLKFSIMLVILGAGLGGLPVCSMRKRIARGSLSFLICLALFFFIGTLIYATGCVRLFRYIRYEVLPFSGQENTMGSKRLGKLFLTAVLLMLPVSIPFVLLGSYAWAGIVYLMPFIIYSVVLIAVILYHFIAL